MPYANIEIIFKSSILRVIIRKKQTLQMISIDGHFIRGYKLSLLCSYADIQKQTGHMRTYFLPIFCKR